MTFKYKLNTETVIADFQEFVKEEKDKLQYSTTDDDFKTFMDQNEDKLHQEFQKQHGFQTSVRGLKVRGVFPTQEEA